MSKGTPLLPRLSFTVARQLERAAAYARGKGYGSTTVAQEARLVRQLLAVEPKLAIDIGGNVGNYTAELVRRTPGLEVHIFEPSATNIPKLRARFAASEQIVINECALSDSTGEATLFSDRPGSGLGSLVKRQLAHSGIPFETTETIRTQRFDEYWISRLQRRPIDIMKLDIEGFELAALQGSIEALPTTRVIQFEFGGSNIDTRTYFRDFWYFFAERSFALFRISPFGLERLERYRESDEFFSTTNYVAVNQGTAATR